MTVLEDSALTNQAIGAFYAVYDALGFGFLESVYCSSLSYEFELRGLAHKREEPSDVFYKGRRVGHYKPDLIVENRLVIEVKASRHIDDGDRKQVLNYLRATNLELALLLHFGPKAVFQRIIFSNDRKQKRTG